MEKDYKLKGFNPVNVLEFLNDIIQQRITTSEVIQVLNENNSHKKVFYYEDFLFYDYNTYSDCIEDLHNQCFELAHKQGGGEGEGEYFCEIIHIKPLGTYIEHTGSYYSYNGIDYLTEYYQVYPKQVLQTIYTKEE